MLSRNGTAEVLSELHQPRRNAAELRRVEEAGGVVADGRVLHPATLTKRISMPLSRTLGSPMYKEADPRSGVLAEPFLASLEVGPDDEFVVVASDGVFDAFPAQDVVDFVHRRMAAGMAPEAIASDVVGRALARGSRDNISAAVLFLAPYH